MPEARTKAVVYSGLCTGQGGPSFSVLGDCKECAYALAGAKYLLAVPLSIPIVRYFGCSQQATAIARSNRWCKWLGISGWRRRIVKEKEREALLFLITNGFYLVPDT